MARSIRWKVKVALNVLLSATIFILILINVTANAQSNVRGINYSCRAARLETVMNFLSKNSGYDFIYSRDLIDISRPVSLTVKDKSINEVLSLIEQQVNVSFKLQDRHIIVKSNPKPFIANSKIRIERQISTAPSFKGADSLLITSVTRSIPLRPHVSHASLLKDHLDRRISELQALLGPGVPRNISPFYISQINFNNRHRSWFASAGTFVGDNSSGLELQAGLPYLYAVFHPRWTRDHGFTGAYGVGNSLNLTGNFSFNTIYMYSGRTTTESMFPFSPPTVQTGPEVRRTEILRLHQVKMAVQYAFSKTISVRAGPVLNYQSTTRRTTIFADNAYPETNFVYRQSGGYYGTSTVVYQNGQMISSSTITRNFATWLGWEAALTYRINFFQRR